MGINEIIKYISVILSVAVISSISSAKTVTGTLFTDPIGKYIYNAVLDYKEEVVFEQTKAVIPLVQKVNQDQTKKNLDKVAGVNASGYSKLIIKKIDENNVTIEVDRQEYFGENTAELKYISKGTFAQGTWADLISNKPFDIKITQESQSVVKNKIKMYLGKIIKCMANENWKVKLIGSFQAIQIPSEGFQLEAYHLTGTKKELVQGFKFNVPFKLMQTKDVEALASRS